jgi:hypothetical protein
MKLPQRLEHTDDLVAALVSSHRAAEVPAPPTDDLLAKIESGKPHPLDGLAPSTREFQLLFGAKTWIAGALGAALLAGMALVAVSERRSPPLPEADGMHPVPTGGAQTAAHATSAPVDDLPPAPLPSQDVSTLPSVVATSPKVAAPASKSPARAEAPREASPATSGSSLRRELELVETARRALRNGDGSAGLSAVDRYEHEFPSGQFSHEGQVMRIEALALIGSREKASRLAHSFLEGNPKSPYVERVRSVLARVETP